jgi:hypothetical protein
MFDLSEKFAVLVIAVWWLPRVAESLSLGGRAALEFV